MPFLATVPDLNMTYAMAFNSYGGGNLSMSFVQNHNTNSYTHTACRAISAAVQHAMPNFAAFACDRIYE